MSGMNLGEDLEIEILLRLPAKSLIRFKCVQRSWNILFKTPTFMKRWLPKHENKNRSLMILRKTKPPYITLLPYDSNYKDPILIEPLSLFGNNSCYIITRINYYGNCNGVFCLEGFYDHTGISQLILWNPTTREVHLIPPAPSLRGRDTDKSLYGFGAVGDEFKVVRLNVCSKIATKMSAEIYNLSTKSWTCVHHSVPLMEITRRDPPKYNAFVNGIYHWITHTDDSIATNILCFDFRDNQCHQLRAPEPCRDMNLLIMWDEVAEIKGSLAYVRQYWPTVMDYQSHNQLQLEIWVMDESGWTKKYDIGPIVSMNRMHGLWKEATQLLGGKVGQPLMSYDHDGNSLRQFQFDLLDAQIFLVHEYVESIAPLSI